MHGVGFRRLKERSHLHNIEVLGEVICGDVAVAASHLEYLPKIIKEGLPRWLNG